MHRFILIAALVLASATAQAGGSRSLTLASNDEQQPKVVEQKAVEQKAVEQKPAETPKAVDAPAATDAPKFVARPAAVGSAAAEAPKAETTRPIAAKTTSMPKAEKPKRRRESTEARVIHELHRHGIYW